MPQELYDKLLDRVRSSGRLSEFNDPSPKKILYFHRTEIGHPESIIVTKDEKGAYQIYEFAHEYSEKTREKRKKIFGGGGERQVRYGRNVATDEVAAIKRSDMGVHGLLQTYALAEKLQTISHKKKQEHPIIKLYSYGASTRKPKPSRRRAAESFYAIMEVGIGDFETLSLLALSGEVKSRILSEGVDFCCLLWETGTFFSDWKLRNLLLGRDYHLKVCDLEGLRQSIKPTTIGFEDIGSILSNLYRRAKNPAFSEQDKVFYDFLYQKSLEYNDGKHDPTEIVRQVKAECARIVAERENALKELPRGKMPPKEPAIKDTGTYSKDDELIADIFYYCRENEKLVRKQERNIELEGKMSACLSQLSPPKKDLLLKALATRVIKTPTWFRALAPYRTELQKAHDSCFRFSTKDLELTVKNSDWDAVEFLVAPPIGIRPPPLVMVDIIKNPKSMELLSQIYAAQGDKFFTVNDLQVAVQNKNWQAATFLVSPPICVSPDNIMIRSIIADKSPESIALIVKIYETQGANAFTPHDLSTAVTHENWDVAKLFVHDKPLFSSFFKQCTDPLNPRIDMLSPLLRHITIEDCPSLSAMLETKEGQNFVKQYKPQLADTFKQSITDIEDREKQHQELQQFLAHDSALKKVFATPTGFFHKDGHTATMTSLHKMADEIKV